jgi:hypothetical protein
LTEIRINFIPGTCALLKKNFFFSVVFTDLVMSIIFLTVSIFPASSLSWFTLITRISLGFNTLILALSLIILMFSSKLASRNRFYNPSFKIFFFVRSFLAVLILIFVLGFIGYFIYQILQGENLSTKEIVHVMVVQVLRLMIYIFQMYYVINFRFLFKKDD